MTVPNSQSLPVASALCQAARLARDARFDGLFYTAVLSTGIYCRPICPARAPKEDNVRYFASAAACAQAGYRPCLRCRPDAAPGSRPASPIVAEALPLLNAGQSLAAVSEALGISDRHLRQCFHGELGVAPKQYQLYQRCLLAKQLLHQTDWPVTDIAFASGFHSVRRFNDCFKAQLQLTPTQVRQREACVEKPVTLTLKLTYRPPYNWPWVSAFLQARAIDGLESAGANHYGRCFTVADAAAWFMARHDSEACAFQVTLWLADWRQLTSAVSAIRRMLDLDSNSAAIDAAVQAALPNAAINNGLRLPQFPSVFEAGIRAVLGQQVSVKAARTLVTQLVHTLGPPLAGDGQAPPETARAGELRVGFPSPAAVADHDLAFLKMPGQRRETLRRLAAFCAASPHARADNWLALKGIGPWTVDYARMRGEAATDIWLAGDLGVKQALAALARVEHEACRPWRSYLTIQMWSQLT
ncbi:DNA-3-methyladenine glycosylase 2 family protein [Simiduia aestuariiviva]|uniref:AraC family transcriptional regulator of adaptative response / DNA-3-methyladenine glycosylase II n=1 Tax=Simiduia aestuariiviva TaxID=1510459 RepID=A0A839UT57_9GAMM|nr:AlkA N-terminal domain-containing protein [Simiduia aestuariiviva]MBB3168688.1 AraC family transcriptional regulator of adaptative response / DNA-3-methyladenine glycosylase II [Simiduia aestuariiviva]